MLVMAFWALFRGLAGHYSTLFWGPGNFLKHIVGCYIILCHGIFNIVYCGAVAFLLGGSNLLDYIYPIVSHILLQYLE